MIRAEIQHDLINAFIRSDGLIVSEETYKKLSPDSLFE
jgi:hypothetical protein